MTDPAPRGRRPPARVLLVTGAYYPEFSSGGLQSQGVAHRLQGRAIFQVLTTSTVERRAAGTVDGVPVARVYVDLRDPWAKARALPRMLLALVTRVPRVDLVHVHGYSGKNLLVAAVAKLFRRPLVMSLHTAKHDEPPAVAVQGRLAWWAFRSADLYLSVSPRLVEAYARAGLAPDRIRLVPNGVDVERFSPAPLEERARVRGRLGLPADRPIVLFVGIFSTDKQPRVLFDAWLRLQRDGGDRSALMFVGATSPTQFEANQRLADEIRDEADRAGCAGRVLFAPPTHQIHDYYRAVDVFVLPSAREGLPVALLEAMACGLPCIASRLPGSTDAIIDSGVNGYLVAPGDVEALAAWLASVLSSPDRARQVGTAARQTVVERYNIATTAEHWLAAYEHVRGTS